MNNDQSTTRRSADEPEPDPIGAPGGHSLLRDFSDGLIVCGTNGIISYVNARTEHLLGRKAGELIGRSANACMRRGDNPDSPLFADASAGQALSGVIEGVELLRPDGDPLAVACEVVAIGADNLLLALRPITGNTRGRVELDYRACHDLLTGLPNRACLQRRLGKMHSRLEGRGEPYSVLIIDLDHFKIINDRYGHATGDRVLAQVARRILGSVREFDEVGRWGGEEFICVLPQVAQSSAEQIAERIRIGLASYPFQCSGREIEITASIGVATHPDDGMTVDDLLARADAALFEAKRFGRNRTQTYSRDAGNVFALANIIERALEEDRIRAAYQPIVELATEEPRGIEAFARLELAERQVMEAAYFIRAAEEMHLVHRIDHRVARDAIVRWVGDSQGEPIGSMFINLSSDFLRHPDLVEDLIDAVRQQNVVCGRPKPLVIEITERHFSTNLSAARDAVTAFTEVGARVAIDDFGSGWSSLNYLVDLPVSFVKLEGPLVRRIAREPKVRRTIAFVQSLAADLGILTVAEGIEDRKTVDALKDLGVDWGQGHLFGRPRMDL